jgi:hypothetical protein
MTLRHNITFFKVIIDPNRKSFAVGLSNSPIGKGGGHTIGWGAKASQFFFFFFNIGVFNF